LFCFSFGFGFIFLFYISLDLHLRQNCASNKLYRIIIEKTGMPLNKVIKGNKNTEAFVIQRKTAPPT
jgi:hypothetical protein